MDSTTMHAWVCGLEEMADRKLFKWLKEDPIYDKEVVLLVWRHQSAKLRLDVFWRNGEESVRARIDAPRLVYDEIFPGLTPRTLRRLEDVIGNKSQAVVWPKMDPEDNSTD